MYLSIALNICKGLGPTLPDGQLFLQKPPLFVYLLAFTFKIFSPSVLAASIVPRVFGALNVLLIYLLGLRITFNRTGAFLCAIFFFSSQFVLHSSSSISIENTLLFFQILSLLLLICSYQKSSRLLLFFSAIALVFGFYTKQTSIVLIPIPFAVWVLSSETRDKIKFFDLLLYYVPFFVLTIPWYVYLAMVSNSTFNDIGEYGIVLSHVNSLGALLIGLKKFVYIRLIQELSRIELLVVVIGSFYLIERAIKKSVPHLVLLLASLLVSIVMLPVITVRMWEIRHINISIIISFVAMGDFLIWFLSQIRLTEAYSLLRKFVIVFVAVFMMTSLLRFENGYISKRLSYSFNRSNFDNENITKIASFITDTVPSGSHIMSCWSYNYPAYFYTYGDYPFFLTPVRIVREFDNKPAELFSNFPSFVYLKEFDIEGKKAIFSAKTPSSSSYFYFRKDKNYVMYEEEFLGMLKEKKIDYLLYSYHKTRSPRELEIYLNEHMQFERIFYKDYASIYRIKKW
jgi:dolichyl-phosphate-mannose-protein mannosyltransferase